MHESHLLVACHGMWGEPVHLSEMARVIREQFPPESVDRDGIGFRVLIAETNSLDSTYDGIDWGGERIADEVQKKIKELEEDGTEKVTRFSVVGYSLGGLLARYLIGILQARNFFDKVKPVNFTTFATPHIGIIQSKFWVSKVAFKLGPKMLSRTGPQFFGSDAWDSAGRPLLEVMADPEGIFFQGLAKFERLSLYGSAYGDRTVGYATAMIENEDPYWDHDENGMTITVDDKYPPIVRSYSIPDRPPTPPPSPPMTSAEYWRTAVAKPRLPPFLQLRFPFNVIMVLMLPVAIPLAISYAYVRVSRDAKHSRRRIKQLEKDESFQDRLVNVLAKMDKNMENAIADLIEQGQEEEERDTSATRTRSRRPTITVQPAVPTPRPTSPASPPSASPEKDTKKKSCKSKKSTDSSASDGKLMFSPMQVKIIDQLNTLPLQKYSTVFPGVFSSHAVIIARDRQRFAFHEQGLPVLQHWADHFIL